MSLVDLDLWSMEGDQLVQMGEEEFKARLPQVHANQCCGSGSWFSGITLNKCHKCTVPKALDDFIVNNEM
jgi:hypothetical protein